MADFQMTREELQAMHEQFRDIKHSINNTLAVIMALSELGQRNPAHFEKLAKAVLQRGPDVVQQLQDFQNTLTMKLKASAPATPPNGLDLTSMQSPFFIGGKDGVH